MLGGGVQSQQISTNICRVIAKRRMREAAVLVRSVRGRNLTTTLMGKGVRGGVVVKALRYKPAGHGFDSRWCHWNFSVT